MAEGLRIRKLADKTGGQRISGFHPVTGEKTLVNPATQALERWPLAGVQIEGNPPARCTVPTSFVGRGIAEGWIDAGETEAVHRSGGPEDNPWAVTHTFLHVEHVTLKTVDGDVRYRVVEQPDKWPDSKDGQAGHGGEVRWFYELEREG